MASATVVSGSINGGTAAVDGSFVKLDTSVPFSVGADNFNTDNLYAFDEQQNVTLAASLALEMGGPVLAAGTVISSHLIAFDPLATHTVNGTVTFDQPILGVSVKDASLAATNFLGAANVTYLDPAGVGLEAGLDFLTIGSPDKYTLKINLFSADTPGDEIRVITAGTAPTAVPEPASWAFMICGFGLAGSAIRRSRSKFRVRYAG